MIKKNIEDAELLEHLNGLPEDCRQVMLLADGQIRLTGLSGTTMVNQMRANHSLGVVETLVLGQAYVASGLMASSVKGNDRIQLAVDCGGPIGGIYTEAWACGAVRGYLKNNPIELKKPLEDRNLDQLFGPGFIKVSRILEGSKTPFTGQIMMEYGDLAKDLALYYLKSEQTPTMFSLGIHFDTSGRVTGAGGLFIQALPGCSEEVLQSLQDKCQSLPSVGLAISRGQDIKDYCSEVFSDYGVQHLSKEPLGFSCPCDRRNYAIFLSRLPREEKDAILQDNRWPLELECFNCGTKHTFTEQEVREIFR
ncbi:MAG: Hsp33 family molecular chaperone HslO [Sphaerochaetaceae bacterium]|nr:Hsp33 family molecular chaperone HslO [Sphaerochaetaceae bacterium]